MNKIYCLLCLTFLCFLLGACQDKDIEREEAKLTAIDESSVTGSLQGDDYVWTWPAQSGLRMQVSLYVDGTKRGGELVEGNTYKHVSIDTNIEYTYVFKLTDGINYSSGVVKSYVRAGAAQVTGVSMSQVDKQGGYDAKVEWAPATDADNIMLSATNGQRIINNTLAGNVTEFLIADVKVDEVWTVSLTAVNSKGNSLTTTASLRIGKTAIGFLSAYATPQELLAKGDDDEASAWLWLKNEYPTAEYIYFGDIMSAGQLEPYRVLFWIRDLEGVGEADVWNMPSVASAAVEPIKTWYIAGGNLLLWGHAIPYITDLGRIDANVLRNNDRVIGTGSGGWNGDVWSMAVQLHPGSRFKKDFSKHPIYKGLDVVTTDRTKLIAFKGAGWTEDHNCLFFNLPSILTGLGNQEEACYSVLTEKFGIYPLGTWDSQIDWVSQLNVWEARQGITEFAGTVLCIGNGGCEFSMKNPDGTPDISAYPKNNIYQDNVLKLAKNSLEYLKTR
ncbi:DUF4960 domain-containing protein [Bacteroides heparinolyticus]|uniref:DUF4960 domain-containing protein n=1 Tax=Prevotella heparinolytica TaxID=28113 RepID=A0A3P2AEM7_9BACE|nr:DUF4960 domain-containing protein [Bacteroides heparinolyticus]RRD92630.1 DUF4960 domain-containing protein [Bacteroides heparinolyticus]VFB14556.1 Uncharacterised protein [Bacteroides heparinolyticus]